VTGKNDAASLILLAATPVCASSGSFRSTCTCPVPAQYPSLLWTIYSRQTLYACCLSLRPPKSIRTNIAFKQYISSTSKNIAEVSGRKWCRTICHVCLLHEYGCPLRMNKANGSGQTLLMQKGIPLSATELRLNTNVDTDRTDLFSQTAR
jgi:hypothetical protein